MIVSLKIDIADLFRIEYATQVATVTNIASHSSAVPWRTFVRVMIFGAAFVMRFRVIRGRDFRAKV
jgi:hypothetical protein